MVSNPNPKPAGGMIEGFGTGFPTGRLPSPKLGSMVYPCNDGEIVNPGNWGGDKNKNKKMMDRV